MYLFTNRADCHYADCDGFHFFQCADVTWTDAGWHSILAPPSRHTMLPGKSSTRVGSGLTRKH